MMSLERFFREGTATAAANSAGIMMAAGLLLCTLASIPRLTPPAPGRVS